MKKTALLLLPFIFAGIFLSGCASIGQIEAPGVNIAGDGIGRMDVAAAVQVVAIDAGHSNEPGDKHTDPAYDPAMTPEWVLNDRIAARVEKILEDYDVKVVRTDDVTGATNVPLDERCRIANEAGADVFVSIHHNAGGGTGIVVYRHEQADDQDTRALQDTVYDALIEKTGNTGNRRTPKDTEDFLVLRKTRMPAVLCEMGYMDHPVDTPLILTEEYAEKCAQALAEALVAYGGLEKR
ncbi:MAG: N-acetylmuramoyl-L-alanine amidase [Christensenellales bacterium]|jgi:N-acetylmuramoyl-L-alanine amidase